MLHNNDRGSVVRPGVFLWLVLAGHRVIPELELNSGEQAVQRFVDHRGETASPVFGIISHVHQLTPS